MVIIGLPNACIGRSLQGFYKKVAKPSGAPSSPPLGRRRVSGGECSRVGRLQTREVELFKDLGLGG